MTDRGKIERIVEARMKLRARFEAKMRATPSLADGAPQGSGPPNRHGMPELPPGQHLTKKWPVLDLGIHPDIARADWRLEIDGACAAPRTLTFEDLLSLEQVDDVSDFHCVTTWSKLGIPWRGVRLVDALALAEPEDDAGFLFFHASDGYTTNIPMEEAIKPDVLLVYEAFGAPLEQVHGGPVRVITPQLYAWKGAKWIARIELLRENRRGFWERNGYSNTAHPWRNDRYS
ncbi:MAG: molybdopterin-dependent oxidoreductase [Myxococcales bacterium]|nr:molybdopterin-dependent oxidoreductase [Myxococcales bacterium]